MNININEFLDLTWIHLAPYAYEKFLKEGRGAILIDISKFKFNPQEDNWLEIRGTTKYLKMHSKETRNMNSPELDNQIKTYNPETNICFIFMDGSNKDADYKLLRCGLRNQPTPKELYESGKNKTVN